MKSSRKLISILTSLSIAILLIWRLSGLNSERATTYPNQPIQVVVPYTAGGGTDIFARIVQKSVASGGLLPQPMVILNQPGGGATIGSRFVLGSRPDGYRLLCHHDALLTSQLSGMVKFGPDDFTAIAQTGSLATMVVVRADSPFENLASLLAEAKTNPNSLRFGADVGSPAYFNAKIIEESAPGSAFNYISTGGGQKRFTMLLGGHLEVGIFSLGEYLGFLASDDTPSAQNIKAIAVLDGTRSPLLPEVTTTMEQGIPINSGNAYYWFAPKGTRQEVIDQLADLLKTTMEDPNVISELAKQSIGPEFRMGDKLKLFLDMKKTEFGNFEAGSSSDLPNFPAWVIGIVIALGLLILLGHWRTKKLEETSEPDTMQMALITAAILAGYIICLEFDVAYAIATGLALFLIGATIAEWQRPKLIPIAQMALLFTLGSEFIFTTIFSVPLP
jgi:putative tricarboxylic transport membrane protein